MKKKIIILIVLIVAILLIGTLVIIFNNNKNKFILNKNRYIINKHIVSSINSDKATSVRNYYYEIDLNKNTVDLREDYIYFDETGNHSSKDKKSYSRKLIDTKSLTQEESKLLQEFLERIIKENKHQNTEKHDGKIKSTENNNNTTQKNSSISGVKLYKYYYYTVTGKNVENIVFDTDENIQEFEEIVKIVKIDGSEDFYIEFGYTSAVKPASIDNNSNPPYSYYEIKRNGAVYLYDSTNKDSYIKTVDEKTLKDIEEYIYEKVSSNPESIFEDRVKMYKDGKTYTSGCSSQDIAYLKNLINK